MCIVVRAIVSHSFGLGELPILEKSFLLDNVHLVGVTGTYPSPLSCLINSIVSLCVVVLLPMVRKGKNTAVFIVFLAAINFVSALFFTFWPSAFPYTGTDFSELYVKAEMSLWLFVPVILGVALLPLPSRVVPKILVIVGTLIYSVIFGTLRYAAFLLVIAKLSFIYAALLFFAFGPLFDFVYIVSIYCFYTARLSHRLKRDEAIWKWLY